MKKNLVFALAALSLVATVRGATVTWESGDLNMDGLAPITSVTAYYYAITDATAAEAAAGLSSWGSNTFIDTNATDGHHLISPYADNVNLIGQATDSDASDGFGGLDYTQTLAENFGEEYVIAVYEATTEFGGKYAVATLGYVQEDKTNEIDGISTDNSYTGGLGSDAITYNSDGGWAAVPEPTTVALLALGLAAVGLKRKVA